MKTDLLLKLITNSFVKCKSNEDLADLLSLMIEHGYASNVIEMILKITQRYDLIKSFDKRIFANQEEVEKLSIRECYITELRQKRFNRRLSLIQSEVKKNKKNKLEIESQEPREKIT